MKYIMGGGFFLYYIYPPARRLTTSRPHSSTPNTETDFGPFPHADPPNPAELKWMWTKIGLGQLWDGPVWKTGIPVTSNIVTLAPREGAISPRQLNH